MPSVYTITKRFEFEASHQLMKLPAGHKCRRLHGHNYVVTIELQARELDEYGFVVDYGELKAFKEHLDRNWDHRHLNDVAICEPTAESLAIEFYQWCRHRWHQVTAATVQETLGTSATYRP